MSVFLLYSDVYVLGKLALFASMGIIYVTRAVYYVWSMYLEASYIHMFAREWLPCFLIWNCDWMTCYC